MDRTDRTRRIDSAVFVVLVCMGIAGVRDAQASGFTHVVSDSEAFNGWGTLTCMHPKGGSCNITSTPDNWAHNWFPPFSVSYATITAGLGLGLSDIGREFRTFKEFANGSLVTCTAYVYVRQPFGMSLVHGVLKVIDSGAPPPRTTPIFTPSVPEVPYFWNGIGGWVQYRTPVFIPSGNSVSVRVSIVNSAEPVDIASLDDLTVECQWTN